MPRTETPTWLVRLLLVAAAGILCCGCRAEQATAPGAEPPYLAIVMRLDVPPGFRFDGNVSYRVVAHSKDVTFDRTLIAAPSDTLIIPVKPGDYEVALQGLPN